MADWRDGPEYAPGVRPEAFVAPSDAAPLDSPDSAEALPVAPPERPDYGPGPDATPLDALTSPEPDRRDPAEAFAVAASPLTSAPTGPADGVPATQPLHLSTAPAASAWGAAHAPQAAPRPRPDWAPGRPLDTPPAPPVGSLPAGPPAPPPQVNPQSFPPAQPQDWSAPYAPSSGGRPQGPRTVTVKEVWEAATTGVMVCLLVGGVLQILAVPLLFVAHGLASRIRYRRRTVERLFKVTEAATALVALAGVFRDIGEFDLPLFWASWQGWSQFGCWVLVVGVLMAVGAGLRAGEEPERRFER